MQEGLLFATSLNVIFGTQDVTIHCGLCVPTEARLEWLKTKHIRSMLN